MKQTNKMEQSFKISIPKPCHENWETMTPEAQGRFCSSCAKTVIDFTAMKTAEIQDYFIRNSENKICGRFHDKQLDTISITIPYSVVSGQTGFHKIFLLALFITMGATLFSCTDEKGNRKSIQSVEVGEERIRSSNVTLGEPAMDKAAIPDTPEKERTQSKCERTAMTKGMITLEPRTPKIKVYKDSITMGGGPQ